MGNRMTLPQYLRCFGLLRLWRQAIDLEEWQDALVLAQAVDAIIAIRPGVQRPAAYWWAK